LENIRAHVLIKSFGCGAKDCATLPQQWIISMITSVKGGEYSVLTATTDAFKTQKIEKPTFN